MKGVRIINGKIEGIRPVAVRNRSELAEKENVSDRKEDRGVVHGKKGVGPLMRKRGELR